MRFIKKYIKLYLKHRHLTSSFEAGEMMSVNNLSADLNRYNSYKDMPKFQKWMRKYQGENNPIIKMIYKILFVYHRNKNCNEISGDSVIGGACILAIHLALL